MICGVALAKLLMKYLEWSATWNMSIVISVLDGIYGAGAFRVSYFLSSGNHNRGLLLMLVFFVFGLFLRVLCILFGCYKGGYGIFLQIGLLCVANTLKFVSCMVYFYDCKQGKLEKKSDGEAGIKVLMQLSDWENLECCTSHVYLKSEYPLSWLKNCILDTNFVYYLTFY
ncbi:hypothetical protein Lalb_Chr07g0185251 [Lupinus albus]|uniref:Uncharacterized protein n=1 Tax=Lupinus albus TaxID=3870 RepID=A0A6A4Q8R8_LUPAL|nr:hypothetical protein Lalb_Chr07g0185251 [Lupinus albus]